jgi:hypothetical protein
MKAADFAALKAGTGDPESMGPNEYIEERVREVLAPQALTEIRNGFWSMIPAKENMKGVTAADLQRILCPQKDNAELNIRKIFRVAMDEEMSECKTFVDGFWSVVDNLTPEEKKRFLVFVTGVESPPEPGMELLTIELPHSAFTKEEHRQLLQMLPQAHTCSNTLELPNYYESLKESGIMPADASEKALQHELVKIFGQKLRMAISEAKGYELDATGVQIQDGEGASALSSAAPWQTPPTKIQAAPHIVSDVSVSSSRSTVNSATEPARNGFMDHMDMKQSNECFSPLQAPPEFTLPGATSDSPTDSPVSYNVDDLLADLMAT